MSKIDYTATAEALKNVYRNMELTIESQEETIEYLTKQYEKILEQKRRIISKAWFKIFASKKMKNEVFDKNVFRESSQRSLIGWKRIWQDLKVYKDSFMDRFKSEKECMEEVLNKHKK